MKIKLNELEKMVIEKWVAQETGSHYGNSAFLLGEEASILEKLKQLRIPGDLDLTFTELEVLKNWSDNSSGIYEEIKLTEKIEKALVIAKKEFAEYLKKHKS